MLKNNPVTESKFAHRKFWLDEERKRLAAHIAPRLSKVVCAMFSSPRNGLTTEPGGAERTAIRRCYEIASRSNLRSDQFQSVVVLGDLCGLPDLRDGGKQRGRGGVFV